VAHGSESGGGGIVCPCLRSTGRRRLRRARDSDGGRMPEAGQQCPARQEHVRAGHALRSLQSRHAARPGPDQLYFRSQGRSGGSRQPAAAGSGCGMGGGESRLQVQDSHIAGERAADRREWKYGNGSRDHGVGHGSLRDVSHYTRHVCIPLSERRIRKSRRCRAPGSASAWP